MDTNYTEIKASAEKTVLALLTSGSRHFCAWTQTPLWLAAKRLVQTGKVRESVVCNVFELA